ncbi:hypothetical protein LMG26411_08127 [Cupriavidus numazuensis]|uniref:Uncharacterized protein n=1 Tax=Cupriavidus numazuensis TaxID=221992 RepID=A0ABM8TWQ9_9BURK|nr:hypothetical protein LMG26411_08127 [Cupriavidus numazuensis]
MGAQLYQLATRRLQFPPPRFPTRPRRGVRLALGRQLGLHGVVRLPRFAQLRRERERIFARGRGVGARGIAFRFRGIRCVTRFGTQRGEFRRRGLVGRLPDGLHRLGGDLLEGVRQVRMVDGDARAPAQLLPERLQHLGGRAHAALAHQAVELVGGGRDAVTEEQQAADLAVQRAGVGETPAQLGQISLQRSVGQIQVGRGHRGKSEWNK